MNIQNLIFSEKPADRILRHVLFWLFWGLYYAIMHAANPFLQGGSYFRKTPFAFCESILILIPQMLIAYGTLYVVMPIYFKYNKILLAILAGVLVWFLGAVLNLYMALYMNPVILKWILPPEYLVGTQRKEEATFFMSLMSTSKGTLTGTAILVSIKYIKQWYLKEKRNLQLVKEKTEAQLQLLTAQVHPHFLFNTLNNIYSQTQTESPKGSKMIMQLSDLLRYILSEGNKSLVPLKKELQMLQDYINLEKIRYGNKLDLHVTLPDETGDLVIAPLLLLPFMENSFKHGASKFLRHPWINLKIRLNGRVLEMKLMNGKDSHLTMEKNNLGTGIINVRRRLELLYASRHSLQITDEPEVFVVNLKLNLEENIAEGEITLISTPNIDYA